MLTVQCDAVSNRASKMQTKALPTLGLWMLSWTKIQMFVHTYQTQDKMYLFRNTKAPFLPSHSDSYISMDLRKKRKSLQLQVYT
jgi:hypothetical protein